MRVAEGLSESFATSNKGLPKDLSYDRIYNNLAKSISSCCELACIFMKRVYRYKRVAHLGGCD